MNWLKKLICGRELAALKSEIKQLKKDRERAFYRGRAETSPNFQPKFYLYFFSSICFYDSADISATRSSGTPWALACGVSFLWRA